MTAFHLLALERRARRDSDCLRSENPKASLLRPQNRRFTGAKLVEEEEEWLDLVMATGVAWEATERESDACIFRERERERDLRL